MRKWIVGLCLVVIAACTGLWFFGARFGLPISAWQKSMTLQATAARNAALESVGLAPPVRSAPTPPLYPAAPLLRVEIGQHVGTILDMAVNEANHLLVTGSDDKTIRVWSLPDATHKGLRLIDVLRPPVGGGKNGVVYGVAISPEARLIAASVVSETKALSRIYVFDRESGQIAKVLQISGNPVAVPLAFSPDGKYLIAGYLDKGGLHVWQLSDWREVAKDTSYRNDVVGIAVDASGRVATSSEDGFVRLYDRNFKLTKLAQVPSRKKAAALAFSPDGNHIALAHFDAPLVTVLDGHTLSKEKSLPMSDMTQAYGTIAWSQNGRYIFAGGLQQGKSYIIRRWDVDKDYAETDLADLPVQNTIMHLAPLGHGGVALVGADALIGAYKDDGSVLFSFGWSVLNNRYKADNSFRISADATVIQLPGQKSDSIRVDLLQHRIDLLQAPDSDLIPGRSEAQGIRISGVPGNTPMLNSAKLAKPVPLKLLGPVESAANATISQSGKWVVLGTEFGLWLYSSDGKVQARASLPVGIMRAVFTPDDRYVVAEGFDGVARWFAIKKDKTGKADLDEILLLYADKNKQQWVAWTPAGYYDASVQGEDLLGWHINRRPDQTALFYGASRFRNIFYRPDIIKSVLATGELPPKPNTDLLLQHLPPIVRILGVSQSDDGRVHVRYVVSSNQPIPNLRVMVDGAAQDRTGARSIVTGMAQELSLAAPEGKGTHVVEMSAAGADLHFGNTEAREFTPAVVAARQHRELWALVVGVGHYKERYYEQFALKLAAEDARSIAAVLGRQADNGYPYDAVHVVLLTDEPGPNQATHERIARELEVLKGRPGPNDVALLYMAGHGVNYPHYGDGQNTNEYVFIAQNTEYAYPEATGITDLQILGFERGARGRKVVFIDTCFAGLVPDNAAAVEAIAKTAGSGELGANVFASSARDQESWEFAANGHGAFTAAVLEAFYGKQDMPRNKKTGNFTQFQLVEFLSDRVETLSRQRQQLIPSLHGSKFDLAHVLTEH